MQSIKQQLPKLKWQLQNNKPLALLCIAVLGLLLFSGLTAVFAALAAAVFGLEKALDRLNIPDGWLYLAFAAVICGALWYAVYVMRRKTDRT